MEKIKIKSSSGCDHESSEYVPHVTIKVGINEFDANDWVVIREDSGFKIPIQNGAIYPENKEDEEKAIKSFREKYFSEFEKEGIAFVTTNVKDGKYESKYSSSLKDKVITRLAKEWIEIKNQKAKEAENLREEENLKVAKRANKISWIPIIISALLLVVAVVSYFKK